MKRHTNSSTVLAILLVLLSTAASDVSRAQRANGAAQLMVSVTVPPICTVAVMPGQVSPANAIAVRCRNLPAAHPQPVVTETMAVRDATMLTESQPEVYEGSEAERDTPDQASATDPADAADAADAADPVNTVAMIVINF